MKKFKEIFPAEVENIIYSDIRRRPPTENIAAVALQIHKVQSIQECKSS